MNKLKTDEEFQEIIIKRRKARMATIDSLPKATRDCVHDYGWQVVNTLLTLGIKEPRHIRHIVETILNEFSPTRGSSSAQGIKAARGAEDKDVEDGSNMSKVVIGA